MSTVTDLEKKVQSLQSQLSEAKKSLLAAQLDECSVKCGQTVRLTNRKFAGEVAVVAEIDIKSYGTWLGVRRYKKDGTLGTRVLNIYSEYEVIA